jgi:hypothetical protein
MKQFVVQYVKGCTICQSTKPNMVWPKIPIYPIIVVESYAYPFQTISWDLIMDCQRKGIVIPYSQSWIMIVPKLHCSSHAKRG